MKAAELFEEAKRLPPKDQPSYVGARLSEALAESGITIWNRGNAIPSSGRWMLVGYATYSLPDLQLLDALKEALMQNRVSGLRVQLFDVLNCANADDFESYVPGIGRVYQTPVVGIWEDGTLIQKAWGFKARQLIEQYLK